MRIFICCDVLEKDEDVMGRTGDQRRVCGGGRRDGVTLWHGNVRVSYARRLHCVSKLHDSCIRRWLRLRFRCWVFDDMSHTGGPSNLALLPIRAGFRVSLSAWQKRRTATRLHSHRSSVSGNWLPLSYFLSSVYRASSSGTSSRRTWN
jgi:hypothetical protein